VLWGLLDLRRAFGLERTVVCVDDAVARGLAEGHAFAASTIRARLSLWFSTVTASGRFVFGSRQQQLTGDRVHFHRRCYQVLTVGRADGDLIIGFG
jgi:hypothetical protein